MSERPKPSIFVNYLYSIIYILSGILFPLLTFPYAARVMQAEGIGIVGHYQSVASYISILVSLGIPLYGIKEIAKTKNEIERSRSLIEILLLHLIMDVVAIVIVALLVIFGNVDNVGLFLLMNSYIVINTIGCEWLYKGIEDFKYISIRNIIVRALAVLFLFSFVKQKDDVFQYAIYILISTAGGNFWNFYRIRKYLVWNKDFYRNICISRHIKIIIRVFPIHIALSSFPVLSIAILGIVGKNEEVGYYVAATKFVMFIVVVVGALSHVLLPRLSGLYERKEKAEFNRLCAKSLDSLFATCPLVCVLIIISAPELISLFCGSNFFPSVLTLRLISPVVISLTLVKMIAMEILYPQNHEIFLSVVMTFGVVLEVLVSLSLYKYYGHNGFAIGLVLSNLLTIMLFFIFKRDKIPFRFQSVHVRYLVVTFLIFFICEFIHEIINIPALLKVSFVFMVGAGLYLLILRLMKDAIVVELQQKMMAMLKRWC